MAPPVAEAIALVGKRLEGGFRVVQHIGSGGTAHVYLAERSATSPGVRGLPPQRVALKVLRGEHRRGTALRRFQREALAAARVQHPNVLEIIEAHVNHPDTPFFAMELLVGLDLADTLAYARVLSPSRAAAIACAVADGLAAAHASGVVHRDVKPENLFLVHAADGREVVKLVDFGFAHVDDEGPPSSGGRRAEARRSASEASSKEPRGAARARTPVGTPGYMAPEQLVGAPADRRSDVYSLGLVLVEMLSGRVPHGFTAPPKLRELRPEVVSSPEMDAVVQRALEPRIDARFQTMTELHAALLATREASGVHRRSDLR